MRRLIDPIELKKSIVVSNIIGDGKTLEELIDEQPDAHVPDTNVGDTINRQAAIDMFQNLADDDWNKDTSTTWANAFAESADMIEDLPAAQPQRMRGKWIYNSPVTMKCDQCGIVIKDWDWHRFKICPGCGADMRGGEQDEQGHHIQTGCD